MRISAVLLPLTLVIVYGCSQPKPVASTESTPGKQEAKPPAKALVTPQQAAPIVSPPPTKSSVDKETDIASYGKKLFVIMGAKEIADRQWNAEMRKSAVKLDKNGLQAMKKPFTDYSSAVSKASDGLQHLKPPAVLAAFHATLASALDRLDENLQLTLEAIDSNDGDEAEHLAADRKKIFEEGSHAAATELDKSGFDVKRYLSEHLLVRKK